MIGVFMAMIQTNLNEICSLLQQLKTEYNS